MLRCAPEDEKQRRSKPMQMAVKMSQDSTMTLREINRDVDFYQERNVWVKYGQIGYFLGNEMLRCCKCGSTLVQDDVIWITWFFPSDFFASLYVHQNALAIIRYSAFESTIVWGFQNKTFLPLWRSLLTLKKICAGCQRVTPFTENKPQFFNLSRWYDDKMGLSV